MVIMDGKEVSEALKKKIAAEVEEMVAAGYRRPKLVAVLVGDDGASQVYVGHKERACGQVGFDSVVIRMPASTTEEELNAVIDRLNGDENVDGFIVQLPLPAHLSEEAVIERISPL